MSKLSKFVKIILNRFITIISFVIIISSSTLSVMSQSILDSNSNDKIINGINYSSSESSTTNNSEISSSSVSSAIYNLTSDSSSSSQENETKISTNSLSNNSLSNSSNSSQNLIPKDIESTNSSKKPRPKYEPIEDIDITPTNNNNDDNLAKRNSVEAPQESNDAFVNGEMIVQFKSLEDKISFVQERGGKTTSQNLSTKIKDLNKITKQSTLELMSQFQNDSRISNVRPNFVYSKNSTPNDPQFSKQWHLKSNNTQSFYNRDRCNWLDRCNGGNYTSPNITAVNGYDTSTQTAKDVSPGTPATVIAIIDEHINPFTSPELADSIYKDASGRIIGKNFDQNCQYDLSAGVENTACPNAGTVISHGQRVAGTIATKTNNGIGAAGICDNCKIMPLGTNSYSIQSMINAIYYAKANGTDIINMSIGNYTPDKSLSDAIQYATTDNSTYKNVFIVASAGNCGSGYVAGSSYFLYSNRCYKPYYFLSNNCNPAEKTSSQMLFNNCLFVGYQNDLRNNPQCNPATNNSVQLYDNDCIETV